MRLLALVAVLAAAPAGACRLALVLALDVSSSVDAAEYRMQVEGVAAALRAGDVQAAILGVPGEPVALAAFQWAGADAQAVILDWRLLEGPGDIEAAAAAIAGAVRPAGSQITALGAAMERGAEMLESAPVCERRVMDVSGDGQNNGWPAPGEVHRSGRLAGVTVNGLVIAEDGAELRALGDYFRAEVLAGDEAFIQPAAGYAGYAEAMRRKLLRELQVLVLGSR